MSTVGSATKEGTARYRERFVNAASGHFRVQQNLTLSSIGVGTYLGNPDPNTDARYRDAISSAVQRGANVIDTAANYRFQRSERAIGEALRTLDENGFDRSEIVICTKGGFLPFDGEPPGDVRRYVEESFVKPNIASFEDIVGGSHCMTPAYLENQLNQSLKNMGVDCVDVYYIHNPESQLGFVSQDEFYRRLKDAFAALEHQRANRKLQFYGVATWNGFRFPSDSESYHSLTKMVALADEVGGREHGFRFVQLPFNLAMPEALTVANQNVNDNDVSTIEAAAMLGVTVMTSASIFQGGLTRGLPEHLRVLLGPLRTDAHNAIQFVRSTPGVTTALVGMSQTSHAAENLELANVEPLTGEEFMQLISVE